MATNEEIEITDPNELAEAEDLFSQGEVEITDPTELAEAENLFTATAAPQKEADARAIAIESIGTGAIGKGLSGEKAGWWETAKDVLNMQTLGSVLTNLGRPELITQEITNDTNIMLDRVYGDLRDRGFEGEEANRIIADASKEYAWTEQDEDKLRSLSSGELVINPSRVFGDDKTAVEAEIASSSATPQQKQTALRRLEGMRSALADKMESDLYMSDSGFKDFADKWEGDKAGLMDAWAKQQKDRNWFFKSSDAVLTGVQGGAVGIAGTVTDTAAGLSALVGAEDVAGAIGETGTMLRGTQESISQAAEQRGLTGGYGIAQDFANTVTQMAPMLIGGAAVQGVKGLAAAATRGMSVYGWAAAQGYGSKLQDAIAMKQEELGRELSEQEIAAVLADGNTQAAAFSNGFQTAVLSKVLGGGAERAALGAAEKLTVADFLTKGGRQAFADAGFREEIKQMGRTIFGDVADEAVEEGLNQFLDKAISASTLGQDVKVGDLVEEVFGAAAMGGLVGGVVPQARFSEGERIDPLDRPVKVPLATPQERAVTELVTPEVQAVAPASAAAAMATPVAPTAPVDVNETPVRATQTDLVNTDATQTPASETAVSETPTAETTTPNGQSDTQVAETPTVTKEIPADEKDNSHLDAILGRLGRERQRLAEATTEKERNFRQTQVTQAEKELADEYKFLGVELPQDDEALLAELGVEETPTPALDKTALKTAFNLTDEQADAAVEVSRALGLSPERVLVEREFDEVMTPEVKANAPAAAEAAMATPIAPTEPVNTVAPTPPRRVGGKLAQGRGKTTSLGDKLRTKPDLFTAVPKTENTLATMSPEEVMRAGIDAATSSGVNGGDLRRFGLQAIEAKHKEAISDAVKKGLPVNRQAFDEYFLAAEELLPKGYIRDGEVYRPDTRTATQPDLLTAPRKRSLSSMRAEVVRKLDELEAEDLDGDEKEMRLKGLLGKIETAMMAERKGAVVKEASRSMDKAREKVKAPKKAKPTPEPTEMRIPAFKGRNTLSFKPASGPKSFWVNIDGDWFTSNSRGEQKSKRPLEAMGLRDSLDKRLAEKLGVSIDNGGTPEKVSNDTKPAPTETTDTRRFNVVKVMPDGSTRPVSNVDTTTVRTFRRDSASVVEASYAEAKAQVQAKITEKDRAYPYIDPFTGEQSGGFITEQVAYLSQSLRRRAVEGDRITPEEANQLWNETEVIEYAARQEFNSPNIRKGSNWSELLKYAEPRTWGAQANRRGLEGYPELYFDRDFNDTYMTAQEFTSRLGIPTPQQKTIWEILGTTPPTPPDTTERFQAPTTDTADAAYLAAVEAGDMATAQAMVDEAARPEDRDSAEVFETLLWMNESRVNPSVFRYGVDRFVSEGKDYWDYVREVGNQPWANADMSGKSREAITEWFENLPLEDIKTLKDVPMLPTYPDNEYSRLIRNGVLSFAKYRKSSNAVVRDESGDVIPLSQRFNPANEDIRFQFAGENANVPQFMRDSLETARTMAAEGKSSEEIRVVTGWFPSPYDGKMRWEIPDNGAELNADGLPKRVENSSVGAHEFPARWSTDVLSDTDPLVSWLKVSPQKGASTQNYALNQVKVTIPRIDAGTAILGSVLNHPMLYRAYPDLFTLKVHHVDGGNGASYSPSNDSIELDLTNPNAVSLLLHEVQHAIQKREGFAKGTSMTLPNYRSSAGEIEARDVQARANMTPEQLKATAPYSSENIAPEAAIVLYQRPTGRPQGAKGSAQLTPDGKVLLKGLQNPDFTTAVHEMAHAFEMSEYQGLNDDEVSTLKAWAGSKSKGRKMMETKASEKFARGWERYIADGRAPLPNLQALFDKMAKWMLDVYGKIRGSEIDIDISPEVRAIFDKLSSRMVAPAAIVSPAGVEMHTDDGSALPPPLAPNEAAPPTMSAEDEMVGRIRSVIENPQPRVIEDEPTAVDENDFPYELFSLRKEDAEAQPDKYELAKATWKQVTRSLKANWEAVLAQPAGYGDAFLDRLVREGDSNRVLTDPEIATLVHEGLRRKQAVDVAEKALQVAISQRGSKELVTEKQAVLDDAMARYQTMHNIAAKARTASGRSLNAWKYAISRDFTYQNLYPRTLAAYNSALIRDGQLPVADLPADQKAKVREYADEQLARQKDITERRAASVSDNSEEYLKRIAEQDALIAAMIEERKQSANKSAVSDLTKRLLVDKVRKAAKEARARLGIADDGIRYQSAPNAANDPRWYDRVLVLAEPLIANPTMTAARFADIVLKQFGSAYEGVADLLRKDVEKHIRTTLADISGKNSPSPEEVVSGLSADQELTRQDVYELARAYVFEGARDFEVMNKVFADLSQIYPELTKDEVTQLFTNYGKQQKLSPTEEATALRAARSLELVQKQIDDLEARGQMKRTGLAKDDPSPELRALRKRRDDLAKEIGYTPTDPATGLSSAQGAAKKRMSNEIQELERAIASGERRVRVRRGVEYTEDMNVLREKLLALRDTYENIFESERTPEERMRLMLTDLDRRIAKERDLINKGILKYEKEALPPLDSPELTARREQLRDLRAEKFAAYDLLNPNERALSQAMNEAEDAVKRRQKLLDEGLRETPQKRERGEGVNPTEALRALWEAADAMDVLIREIRKNRPLTPAQQQAQLDRAYAQAVASREALRTRIETGDILSPPKTAKAVEERTRAIREENAAMRKQITQMQRDAGVGAFAPEVREAKRVASLEARIAELKRRRAEKDFSKKAVAKPVTNEKIAQLELDMELAKYKFEEARARDAYKGLRWSTRKVEEAMAVWHARQMFNLSGDLGIFGRQLGKVGTLALQADLQTLWNRKKNKEPLSIKEGTVIGKTLGTGLKVFLNPKLGDQFYADLATSPRYAFLKANGLDLTKPHESSHELSSDGRVRVNPMLLFSNRVLGAVMIGRGLIGTAAAIKVAIHTSAPVWKAVTKGIADTLFGAGLAIGGIEFAKRVESAQLAMLNIARVAITESMLKMTDHLAPTDKEAASQAIVETVMTFTGKISGKSGLSKWLKNNAYEVGLIFSFPQYMYTNLQAATGTPMIKAVRDLLQGKPGSKTTLAAVSLMSAHMYGGYAARIVAWAILFGVWDEDDEESTYGVVMNPDNPNFLKLKLGKTYLDFAAGWAAWLVKLNRFASDTKLNSEMLRDGYEVEEEKTSFDKMGVAGKFLKGQLQANIRTALEFFVEDEFREGGKLSKMDAWNKADLLLNEIVMNLTARDIRKMYDEHDPATATILSALLMTGRNINIRETTAEKEKREAEEQKRYTK